MGSFNPSKIAHLERIADQARLVRERQRQYFKTRTPFALSESKDAEMVLDGLLDYYFSGAPLAIQDDMLGHIPRGNEPF